MTQPCIHCTDDRGPSRFSSTADDATWPLLSYGGLPEVDRTMEVVNDIPVDLPGHDVVREGLGDILAGRETVSALLVTMAGPRLRALGFDVPTDDVSASHRLYELLSEGDVGAHSRYNALVGRIVSFARAAEHASAR